MEEMSFYFLTFHVSIANEIRQQSAKILFADISKILRHKQQLSVILVFCDLLSPTFISPIMSNPLQSESASSSINNSSSTNNLTVQQILDCNQDMVSAMTSDMEVTITSLAKRIDLHVNKVTAAVNSLSSTTFNNLGKDRQDQRIRENPERSDNSETGEVDEVLNIHEDDRTLYQEQEGISTKAFLEMILFSQQLSKGFLTLTM